MKEKQILRVGQVWQLKPEIGSAKILISSLNSKERKVWASGYVDEVDPIISFDYLAENYDLIEGWNI